MLPAKSSHTISISVKANNEPGYAILTASITSDPADLNPANNSDAAQIEILAPVFLPFLLR